VPVLFDQTSRPTDLHRSKVLGFIEPPDGRQVALERYRREIANGTAAHFIAESNASADRMNYRHMVPARTYGAAVQVLGQLAGMGDMYADAASQALRSISPFLNDWQMMAGVARAFSTFIRTEWEDVREATGPEAGRPSSHRQAVAPVNAVVLHLALTELGYHLQLGSVPGPGWALRAIVADMIGDLPMQCSLAFPRAAEALRS
jgi:hypothetical protein